MPFTKIDYSQNDILTAEQVNAIQDAILEHEGYLNVLNNIPRDEAATADLLKISTDKHNYYDITSGLQSNTWAPASTDSKVILSHTLLSSGVGTVNLSGLGDDITAGNQSALKVITFRINRGNSAFNTQNPLTIKLCDGLSVYQQNSYRLMVQAADSSGSDISPTALQVIADNTEMLVTFVRGHIEGDYYTAVYFDDTLFWEYSGTLYKQASYSAATVNTGVSYLNSIYVNQWSNSNGFTKAEISAKIKNMVEKFKIDRNIRDTVNLSNFLRDLEFQINEISKTLNLLMGA